MHVLATALFDRPAFRSAIVHGIVLGDDGRKMSKSLRNYPDVYEMFDRYGSDAMRWTLMSSPVLRGGDMAVTEVGDPRLGPPGAAAAVERVLLLHALRQRGVVRGDGAHGLAARARPVRAREDRASWSTDATTRLDEYDISGACASVRAFLDALTNWYVRRSRDRFWAGDAGRRSTRSTPCWRRVTRVMAPLAPLAAEEIWRGLTGGRSVHLTDWPAADCVPGRPRAGRRDGRGARRLLGRAVAAQGARPAGAAAAGRR